MFSFLKICKELSGSITEEWASHPESSDNFPNANSTVGFVAAENDNAISASSRFIIFVFDFNASCVDYHRRRRIKIVLVAPGQDLSVGKLQRDSGTTAFRRLFQSRSDYRSVRRFSAHILHQDLYPVGGIQLRQA